MQCTRTPGPLTGDPHIAKAKEEVQAILQEEVDRVGNGQAADFVSFMLSASTQEIRGLGCSHAERAQLAAWLAPSEERRLKALHAYRLIEGAYVCYDTPKKFPMKVVRRVLARLLSDAGLAVNSDKMSDYVKANYFNVEAHVDRKRPWVCLSDMQVQAFELGTVWLPETTLQLSGSLGPLLRKHILQGQRSDYDMPPTRSACAELARLVAHKLRQKLPVPLKIWLKEGRSGQALVQAIEDSPVFRKRGVSSFGYLASIPL